MAQVRNIRNAVGNNERTIMKEDRFITQRVQFSKKFGKFGLWGIYDTKKLDYLLFGSKGQIKQACKTLSLSSRVTVSIGHRA